MTGFVYRRAVALKDMGERLGWSWLVRLGPWLKEAALRGKVR